MVHPAYLNSLTLEESQRARAKSRHLAFMRYTWQKDSEPLIVGNHTKAVCHRIDQAFTDYRNGKSTFLMCLICFRHGKSDLSSRYLPPHFLGEFPDDEVMVISYNASKAYEFSRFGRRLLESQTYRELYPHIMLSQDHQSVEDWSIEGYQGKSQYIGIGGGSAGKGGNLIIIDDLYANRAEAESETTRESRWMAFKDDIMTRRAPRCIFIIVVTPWHVDDVIGRIRKEQKENDKFPRFEEIVFPAFDKKYKDGILFPERFDKNWYESQQATLGTYSSASLMQCNPVMRTGTMLRVDKIKTFDKLPQNIEIVRTWDLASSTKARVKDDPDYTVGVKGGVGFVTTKANVKIPIVYIDDIVRGQWEALKRQEIIRNTAIGDGSITVGVEAYGAYKDSYTELRDTLLGLRTVRSMQLSGDKVAKAAILEPILEAGNFYVKKNAPWVEALVKEFQEFPSGKHDDIVDTVSILVHMLTHKTMPGIFTI